MNKRVLISGAIVLAALTATVTYTVTFKVAMNKFNQVVSEVNERQAMYQKLSDIDQTIRQDYIGEIDEDKINDGIAKGYISGLDNSEVIYKNKEDYKSYTTANDEKATYIGIDHCEDEQGYIKVLNVWSNSPAEREDIKSGDRIVSISNIDLKSLGYENASNMLFGKSNAKVNLRIKRTNENNEEVEIDKSIILPKKNTNTVQYEIIEDNIGYIRIPMFLENTRNDFEEAVEKLKSDAVSGFVVDLRGCKSNNYENMVSLADTILPEGDMVNTVDRDGNKEVRYKTTSGEFDYPLEFLVDNRTAGAAEIFASAIKDYRKASVIGEKTKGRCQRIRSVQLSDGSGIAFPIAYYTTSVNDQINGNGVQPNIEVKMSSEQSELLMSRALKLSDDPQVSEAIKQLRSLGV